MLSLFREISRLQFLGVFVHALPQDLDRMKNEYLVLYCALATSMLVSKI